MNKGYKVYTTFRLKENSKELLKIKNSNLHLLQIDILKSNSLDIIISFVNSIKIDILIHNAGTFAYKAHKVPDLDSKVWLDTLYINSIFPIQLSLTLKHNLMKSKIKKIVFISSRRGSNSINIKDSYRGRYAYRSSKAALNSAAIALSQDFYDDKISTLILHPGRVSTKITNYDGIPPKKSALNIIKLIENLNIKNTGRFLSADTGKEIDW